MTRRFFLSCILLFFICAIGCSQTNTFSADSVITESSMTEFMWKEWNTLDSTWTRNMFPSCLMENHLKLSCADCGKIFITVQIKIDTAGKMVSYKKIKENMCGESFTATLEKCFFDFFYFIEFPVDFRNKTIEVRLGNGLKC